MGWEVELNAIPSKCALNDLVRNRHIDPELLQFVRYYFRLRRKQGSRISNFALGEPDRELFVDALEELIDAHPGIEARYC